MKKLVFLGISAVFGCASGSGGGRVFSPEWQNDGGKSIAAVQARIAAAKVDPGPGVAVGVTDTGLSGVLLDGSGKWKHAGKVDAMPSVSGGVGVATTGGLVGALE
ncbi:MAG TPA: hypothetical protein PKA88_19850 [Polyangiaceae bacterium]|nr:hypothetical protein [Polyangiaceae bacterium]